MNCKSFRSLAEVIQNATIASDSFREYRPSFGGRHSINYPKIAGQLI